MEEVCTQCDIAGAVSPVRNGDGIPGAESARAFEAKALIRDDAQQSAHQNNGCLDASGQLSPPDRWSALRTTGDERHKGSPRRHVQALYILLVATVVTLSYLWFASRAAHNRKTDVPGSIAVLPFRLLGDEASDEYLGS
ncbi:MAG: hypothetical protein H0X14_00195 [Acidobacteria bacterium]|nr:hypothetical protein [Acidobacteriota bacterium]